MHRADLLLELTLLASHEVSDLLDYVFLSIVQLENVRNIQLVNHGFSTLLFPLRDTAEGLTHSGREGALVPQPILTITPLECALRSRQRFVFTNLVVDLTVFLSGLRNQSIFFEADLRCFLLKAPNEHSELLVQKACILGQREDRLNSLLAQNLLLILLSLQADVAIDLNQVVQLSTQVLKLINQFFTDKPLHFCKFRWP